LKKKSRKQIKASTFVKNVLDIFSINPSSGFNYKQVSQRLGISDTASRDLVKAIIEQLAQNGELVVTKRGKYQIKDGGVKGEGSSYLEGFIDMKPNGKAYLLPKQAGEDIYIAPLNTAHALHGDQVRVFLFPKRKGKKPEGQVIEIIKRNKTQIVGTLEVSKNFAFLVPDAANMPVDVFIPVSGLHGAKGGQKVIARITEWPPQSENPFGEVVTVLGTPGENDVEMKSILTEYDFPLSFSGKSEKEAEEFPAGIPEKEVNSRRDFRDIFTLTIDPADAKDFDDAVSLKELGNGQYEVGIHIADVSYYVKPGTAIDDEAYSRATSIYLVDRVIPMLPERLSNNLCSLVPGKDRLCMSAVFQLNESGKILGEWYGRTVIHSRHRFSYEEVQQTIETGEGTAAKEILILDKLAKKLRAERFKKGSINFETQEVRFRLDDRGNPLEIYLREMKDSNKLIEDFMLLANRKVAEFIGKTKERAKPRTFVYRVHDTPLPEKLENFTQLVRKLGYNMNLSNRKTLAQSFNTLFEQIKGKGEENMVEGIAIRTMAKAYYSTENIGHYGLGFPYYTHFTSPIRRYPDLMVHRMFFSYLNNGASFNKEEFEAKCDHTSEMERKAESAERMSVKYKQAEFMLDKVGQVFDGLISGVSKWGFFVEVAGNKCEGLVRLKDLSDDFYYYDEENWQVIGTRKGHQFRLGDKVRIKVKRVDLPRKQMDFALVNHDR
jgi:ribonuclease R